MALLPNLLSMLRLALAPLVFLAIQDGQLGYAAPLVGLAILSDLVDGPLARRLKATSSFGSYLDVSADFAFLMAAVAALVLKQVYPPLLLVIMLGMFLQFVLRPKKGRLVYDPVGKYYGTILYGMLVLTLLAPDLALARALYLATLVLSVCSLLSRIGAYRVQREAMTSNASAMAIKPRRKRDVCL
jgi:phosphatidylglycerophosphate synthase